MLASVQGVKTAVLDVESHLKNEVMREFDKQKPTSDKATLQEVINK